MKNSTRTFGVKARAILAGSLVLGVGAAVTLASWNDSELAAGAFSGGSFNIQSSTDGTTFRDNSSAATLSFPLSKLSPGDTVSAPFAVKLSAASTNAADINITSIASSTAAAPLDISNHLSYTIVKKNAWGCSPAPTGTTDPVIVQSNSANLSAPGTAFTLGAKGATTYLCIAVTAKSTLPQDSTGTLTWNFSAVSNAAL